MLSVTNSPHSEPKMKSFKSLLLALVAGFSLLSVSFAGETSDAKSCGDCADCGHCCSAAEKTSQKTATTDKKTETPAEAKTEKSVAKT